MIYLHFRQRVYLHNWEGLAVLKKKIKNEPQMISTMWYRNFLNVENKIYYTVVPFKFLFSLSKTQRERAQEKNLFVIVIVLNKNNNNFFNK